MSGHTRALAGLFLCFSAAAQAEIQFAPPSGESALGIATYGVVTLVGRLNNAGHSSVYFPHICPDGTPFKLRKCAPGEPGSFLSRYGMMGRSESGEGFDKDWSLVPALQHLYGVEKVEDAPIMVTEEIAAVIKESNRQKYLSQWLRGPMDGEKMAPGQWENSYAVLVERGVDILLVDIDEKETESLIDFFNSSPNQSKFNVLFANCADNTKAAFNHLFPGAVHRSVKDFLATSPTAVANGASKFGKKNPERHLRYVTLQQLPGTYKYDGPVRSGMDNAWKEPQYLLPLLNAPNYLVPFFVISMFDRYNKDKERVKYPSLEVAELREQLDTASRSEDAGKDEKVSALKRQIKDTVEELKTREDAPFAARRNMFTWLVSAATAKGLLTPEQSRTLREPKPQNFLKSFKGADNTVKIDPARGLLLTQVSAQGGERTAGLSPSNIEREDPSLGFEVVVGAINYMLKVEKKDRPALADLERNWEIMRRLAARQGFEVPEKL